MAMPQIPLSLRSVSGTSTLIFENYFVGAWYFDELFFGHQVFVKISSRMCLISIFSVLIGRGERVRGKILTLLLSRIVLWVLNIWEIF